MTHQVWLSKTNSHQQTKINQLRASSPHKALKAKAKEQVKTSRWVGMQRWVWLGSNPFSNDSKHYSCSKVHRIASQDAQWWPCIRTLHTLRQDKTYLSNSNAVRRPKCFSQTTVTTCPTVPRRTQCNSFRVQQAPSSNRKWSTRFWNNSSICSNSRRFCTGTGSSHHPCPLKQSSTRHQLSRRPIAVYANKAITRSISISSSSIINTRSNN